MKFKIIVSFLCLSTLLLLAFNAEAANKKFKILFSIPPTADTALASKARSYITRELRDLNDVKLIEKEPRQDYFFISVVPVPLKLADGSNVGYAISYVFEKDDKFEHNVLIGSPDELKALCEKIVAFFDTYWLAPERLKGEY